MINPYWIRLRGTGAKKSDWDEGRVFGGADFQKGIEIYVGTQQGGAFMKVSADGQGKVRARVGTAEHRFPPKSGRLKGVASVVAEFYLEDPERPVPSVDQMSMFGVGSEICRSCEAPIYWVETKATGTLQPLDRTPKKGIVMNRDGKAEVVDVYMPHHATCPDAEKWRR